VTVTVRVVDRANKGLAGEAVRMIPTAPKPTTAEAAKGPKPAENVKVGPIAEGTTDDAGTVVFKDIPTGSYIVTAQGARGKGHGKTNVHAKDVTATVVATLKSTTGPHGAADEAKPTTQPQ
jgi:hypothetical protein